MAIEVSSQEEEHGAGVATDRSSWIPAVHHLGTLGHWAYFEIHDPWTCQKELRQYVPSLRGESAA